MKRGIWLRLCLRAVMPDIKSHGALLFRKLKIKKDGQPKLSVLYF